MAGAVGSATLEAMIAAGLEPEQMLAIVRGIEADNKPKDPGAAVRMARMRARRSTNDRVTRNVTQNPPNEVLLTPEIPPVEAEASTAPRGRSDRGSKISEDWQAPPIAELPDEARALAAKWPAAAYRAEAEAFRNFWLAESRATARKSNWNRAWYNRIVAINGKVMRDARSSGTQTVVGKANGRSMNAAELRSAIAFAEDHNDPDRAAELKRQLGALRSTGPPGQQIGNAATSVMRGIEAR